MSFVGKVLASIGIGAAKVDTILSRERLVPGENAEGVVRIQGGHTQQEVGSIYFSLYTSYQLKLDGKRLPQTAELVRYRLTKPVMARPGGLKEIPFSFPIPYDTPVTIGNTKVWVKTGLEIDHALDPIDRDYITIAPSDVMAAVLRALGELGFKLHNADCEHAKGIFRSRLPLVQAFGFLPAGDGPFSDRIKGVEAVFRPQADSTEVILQIDRRTGGNRSTLADMEKPDESLIRIKVTDRDIPSMTSFLQYVIERCIKK
jgi:sporulation-control protein